MEIITTPNQLIIASIGEQAVYSNKDYRFNKHCLITDIDNGKLIFNGLTRTLVFLTNDEVQEIGNINKYDYLYKYYFLVPEDFNEEEVEDSIRETRKVPIDDLYLTHPSSFTILTTTRCNARCFYCYEIDSKKKHHMTEDTAKQIARYIHTVAPTNRTINIHWFGGEPLFNMKVIDIIVGYLRDNGRPYTTTFTTNGYLFNKDLIIKAKNIWNTVNCQITIDGTETVYNKIKNYVTKDPISPYKKVLNNIAILLNNGIKVSIRMNIDKANANNLKLLVYEIRNRFGVHPNLSLYSWIVFEDEHYQRTPEEHKQVFKDLKELEDTIEECGYFAGVMPSNDIAYSQCMADDGHSVLISQYGNLGTCEHYIDSNFWGHINYPLKKDFTELNKWRLYEKPLNICHSCPLYPSCIRPSNCQEMSKCDEYYKEWRIRRATRGIIQMYKNYRNQNNNYMPVRLAENML